MNERTKEILVSNFGFSVYWIMQSCWLPNISTLIATTSTNHFVNSKHILLLNFQTHTNKKVISSLSSKIFLKIFVWVTLLDRCQTDVMPWNQQVTILIFVQSNQIYILAISDILALDGVTSSPNLIRPKCGLYWTSSEY